MWCISVAQPQLAILVSTAFQDNVLHFTALHVSDSPTSGARRELLETRLHCGAIYLHRSRQGASIYYLLNGSGLGMG